MANDGNETPTQLILHSCCSLRSLRQLHSRSVFLIAIFEAYESTMSDAVDEFHFPVLCHSASLSACSVLGSLTVSGDDEAFLRRLWSPHLCWPAICASVRIGPWRAPTWGPVGEESSKLSLEVSYKFFCVLGLASVSDVLAWDMSEWLIIT